MTIELYHGDCLDIMPTLPDRSFDAIIADLPYGTTACKWDTVIPFEPLWEQYKRLIKPRGAIVLFGSQPFTSALVMSNVEWFRYEWVWKKNLKSGNLNARHRPMVGHESLAVFSCGSHTYNPQKRKRASERKSGNKKNSRTSVYGKQRDDYIDRQSDFINPDSVLFFDCVHNSSGKLHPTQKPIALLEYLILTYTNIGDTVLDNTMGSGTAGVACVRQARNFVGIELLPQKEDDPDYFGISQRRIETAQNEMVQLSF